MADQAPDFTPISVAGNKVPVTEDTALNQLENTGNAPSFAGGYYGDQVEASGGGFNPLNPAEQQMLSSTAPGQSAILNNYDIGPSFSSSNESQTAESPFGPNAKYYDLSLIHI